ncbi:LexA repressor [Rothia dentocariosa]|uniref:LexA repressor n=1 Tax=Rothia dentocariosa TaxID=2047 RepID=A0A3S5BU65_9MICC|nr:LexA repressor [Rothia dentocariosa]
MRQIGDIVGLASLSSVTHQLGRLEKMGYIRRDPKLPRAIEILDDIESEGASAHFPELPTFEVSDEDMVPVPLVGRIAAGGPITAEQSVEDVLSLPASSWAVGSFSCFASKGIR